MQLADLTGESISLIPAFGSFKGASDAPTSIILFFFINIKYEPGLPGPNKQTNKQTNFFLIFRSS